ncbi:hypothetical protein SYNPS1DRAFT_32084 [Syncephalis pseudoplumigaleata]|uniref:Uncharacterized protein n=1 Tax=Syncephalis pseudoplumigaleata TaxID=1712513 RepID=A0A4P9YRI1_9FUNG|nr:hypothetical protein SYNPS1DRAFT_32084 [Syncephalis pseudoplumigaleata]|eukprot:RKP22334.1 hypothetical protein SYNPS1DRAFT_32084 [Syncephalis pseudoplumigaleata]
MPITMEGPSWSGGEKARMVRKCPSSPGLDVQDNGFVIATDVRRSPMMHRVSDASGQSLCMVKRGGRLRRRHLRRAVTLDGRELNWSLYMPKSSKGFPRFLWCGGRKNEGKIITTGTDSRDQSQCSSDDRGEHNSGVQVQQGNAILASANAHGGRSMMPSLSSSNGRDGSNGPLQSSPTPGMNMDCAMLNSNDDAYCPLGISSEQGVKLSTRKQRPRSSMSGPYCDNREIIIETRIKEYIKTATATTGTQRRGDPRHSTSADDDHAHHYRLLYFHWKTAEYAWRWDPTTRRLDCLCTRPNQCRSTIATPISTPLRTPQAAMSTPSLLLSSTGVSPSTIWSSLSAARSNESTSSGYFARPITTTHSHPNGGGGSSSTSHTATMRRTVSSGQGRRPSATSTIGMSSMPAKCTILMASLHPAHRTARSH